MFLFLLNKYVEMELLNHSTDVYLTLQETAKLFSKLVVPFCILTSIVWKFQVFHVLSNTFFHYLF